MIIATKTGFFIEWTMGNLINTSHIGMMKRKI